MAIQVRLLDHSHDPIRSLYIAYRTCYSTLTPIQILERIDDERITREQMLSFVEERLKTGHVSPLEQVWFEYVLSVCEPGVFTPVRATPRRHFV